MRDTGKYFKVPDIDLKRERVRHRKVRQEGIDAEQIRKPKKAHGGGKPQSDIREEGWRTREHGKGVQPSRRRKRKEAARKAHEEAKEKPKPEEEQPALGITGYVLYVWPEVEEHEGQG